MLIVRGHKVRIYPDERQIEYFHKAFGVKKFIWNHLVWRYKQKDAKGEYTKYSLSQSREFYKELKEKHEFLTEVSSRVAYATMDQYDETMRRYFKHKKSSSTSKRFGAPVFKRKVTSFTIDLPGTFRIIGNKLFIERLNYRPRSANGIKMGERLRFQGEGKQLIISTSAGKWYASTPIWVEHEVKKSPKAVIGVDMGIKNLAILSDGTKYPPSNLLTKALDKVSKEQRKLSKKKRGSNEYLKQQRKVQKEYRNVVNKRNDLLHKITTELTDKYKVICMEDLKPSEMTDKSRRLSLMLSDASFWEFRRQLEYKAKMKDGIVIVVDQYFPSTKMCSGCGKLKDMKLSNRTYKCIHCGLVIDRDINAAINIEREGFKIYKNPKLRYKHKFRKTLVI